MLAENIRKELRSLASAEKAKVLQGFFKTKPGEYGEGDVFLGVTVPACRSVVKKHWRDASLADVEKLLHSRIHEERLAALFILVAKYPKADSKGRADIFDFYLKNTEWINNWDLVDLSCRFIVGEHLRCGKRGILYKLSKSKVLWERRIAIVSTYAYIREGDLAGTFALAETLLHDGHDLMHKAVGWMLREAGKRDGGALRQFLAVHAAAMPRTMLRYAIEKFPEYERKSYLRKA